MSESNVVALDRRSVKASDNAQDLSRPRSTRPRFGV